MANAIVVYRIKPMKNSWARWMVGRTKRQNKNNLIAILGKTGSGKTYSAMAISEIMSRIDNIPFTIEHVVFSLRELMDLINSGNLKSGSKIVFDEPQVSISAREFQSQANKVFNYLLSTFRHRNLTLFFCTPFESLLDKNTRKLFHARFETMSINKNTETCRLKPRYIEYSDFKAEPYRKRLMVAFKDGEGNNKSTLIDYWDVPKPSKKLIEQYEKKKMEFTTNLNRNISERLKKFDESGKSVTSSQQEVVVQQQQVQYNIPYTIPYRRPLTEKQEAVMRTLANIKEKNKIQVASKILNLGLSNISAHRKYAEKKGWTFLDFIKKEQIVA